MTEEDIPEMLSQKVKLTLLKKEVDVEERSFKCLVQSLNLYIFFLLFKKKKFVSSTFLEDKKGRNKKDS